MSDTELVPSDRLRPRMATGYRLRSSGPEAGGRPRLGDCDPYAYRLDLSAIGMTSMRVVFSQQSGAGTTAVHLDLMPVTAHKRPEATNPRRWLTGALAAGTTAVALRSLGRHRGPTALAGRRGPLLRSVARHPADLYRENP